MAIYKSDIVNIDLDSGSIFRSFLNNTIGTADKDANRFGVRVFRSGAEVDLSGCSCYGYFRDPQGNNIALTSVGTVSGNEAYITLPQACYNYEGQFCLAIKLIGGGVTGTVRIIDGVVDNTNTGSAVAPTSAVPTYTEILSQYDAMVAATAAANTAIAPTFAQGTAYAAGALVINDGALYALPNGHTSGTTWANTTKVATNLGDQVTSLKSAINFYVEEKEKDFTGETTYNVLISSSTGKWSVGSNNYSYIFALPEGATKIKLTANSSQVTVFALLKDDSHTGTTYPHYATGCSRTVIQAGESGTYEIPYDCEYVTILYSASGTVYMPSSVKIGTLKEIPDVDEALETAGDAADAKATGDAIGGINSIIFENRNIDFLMTRVQRGIISSSDGKWVKLEGRNTYFIPVDGAISVTVKANSGNPSVVALLTNDTVTNGATPSYATGCGREVVQTGETETFSIPSDAKFIAIMKNVSSTDYTPESASVYAPKQQTKIIPLGLHTMPDNEGVLNVIKRCRQMTDIKWTPAVDLPRFMYVTPTPPSDETYNTGDVEHYNGVFKAGKEYKGIPYGRPEMLGSGNNDYGYTYAFVGRNIDFETFVTAVQNSESIISKQDMHSVALHRSIPYATVCSGLTCYVLGLTTYYATAQIPSIPGLNLVDSDNPTISEIDISKIKLGDVLDYYDGSSGHTVVVTDIAYDTNGDIAFIEESEATTTGEAVKDIEGGDVGGLCRRVGFDVADFVSRFGDYRLYRYAYIGNVPYTPSKYVNVGDEMDMFHFGYLPCMPYMGEGFKYKSGKIPNSTIVLLTNNYGYLRVFKDGAEITGSPFTVSSGAKSVNVGFSETGDYEAYLCNMSNGSNTSVTAKCHWSVIES